MVRPPLAAARIVPLGIVPLRNGLWRHLTIDGDWQITAATGRATIPARRLSMGGGGSGPAAGTAALSAGAATGSCRAGGRTSSRIDRLRRIARGDQAGHSDARYRMG